MLDIEEEKFIDIDRGILNVRIDNVKEQLISLSTNIRKNVPTDMPEEELLKNDLFKRWMIANLILDSSNKDEENESFNLLLYYMFEQCNTIYDLVAQYDLEISRNEDGSYNFGLIVIEPEEEV